MTTDHESYLRIRTQLVFLLDIVELLAGAVGPESRVGQVADEAVGLVRRVLSTTERAADHYASLISSMNELLTVVATLKREGRSPTHVEWEGLRAEIERASDLIASADN